MGLKIERLENVKQKADGSIQAQCPACAAMGGDKEKRHLIVYPNGAYGCVRFQKDKTHNKEIWKLAGDDEERRPPIRVKVQKSEDTVKGKTIKSIKLKEMKGDSSEKSSHSSHGGGDWKDKLEKVVPLVPSEEGMGQMGREIPIITSMLGSSSEPVVNVSPYTVSSEPSPPPSGNIKYKKGVPGVPKGQIIGVLAQNVQKNSSHMGNQQEDPSWEIVHYASGPPAKIWRWRDGRVGYTCVDQLEPPKPCRFTTTRHPDEEPGPGDPDFDASKWKPLHPAPELNSTPFPK